MLDITKRGGVMLAVMALIGAVLASAVSAQTVTTPYAEKTTSLSACVGDAIEEHGFVDIDSLGADWQDAINCLAYYGITVGTGDGTTYSPGNNVTRGQMALFLYRTATAAGVKIDAETERAAMYSDIGELGDEWQTAIKALYAHNIMTGRKDARLPGVESSDTFVPHGAITRAEMGHYLRNLMRAARPDLFNDDGELDGVTLDHFEDARTGTPGPINDAIAEIYELGITVGTSATPPRAFSPADPVTRGQMALFLTRTLAHTSARPAGFTVQQDGSSVVASLRDRNFSPVIDAYVDVFVADAEDAEDALARDGSCDQGAVREAPRYYHDACEIDVGDIQTTEAGDAVIDLSRDIGNDGLVAWVWSGDLGDSVGDEADEDDLIEVRFTGDTLPPPTAEMLKISYSGLRTNPADETPILTARSGAKVRVNLQLQGRYDYGDDEEYYNSPSPAGGAEYSVEISTYVPDATMPTNRVGLYSEKVVLDADGAGSFDLPTRTADSYDVTYTLTEVRGNIRPDDSAAMTVKFRSGDSEVTTVIVNPVRDSLSVADNSRNAVRVTVLDQYGRAMNRVAVLLSSDRDLATSSPWSLTREGPFTTRRNGAVISYTYTGTAAVETLTARWESTPRDKATGDTESYDAKPDPFVCPEAGTATYRADPDGDGGKTEADGLQDVVCATAKVYWTGTAEPGEATARTVLDADTDANTITVDTAVDGAVTPVVLMYDDGDYFNIGGPVSMAAFEERLTSRLEAIESHTGDTTPPDSPTLAWSNYDPDEPADESITDWELTIP